MVYFAADRLRDRRPASARYSFVGFATVQRKVSQLEIWQSPELEVYRSYRNLLVRPARRGFEHYEPSLPRAKWHNKDWCWRIADTRRRKKADFDAVHRIDRFIDGQPVAGTPLTVARNYVLFDPDPSKTLILAEPPVVATARSAGEPEQWCTSGIARDVYALLRLPAAKRSLRTTHPRQPHRHSRIETVEPAALRRELRATCSAHGLRARSLEA